MKILDWYIIKKFLVAYIYTVFLFCLIIVSIDYVDKNDDYISNDLGFFEVLSTYYIYYIPYLANMLSPIMIFIATVFVTSNLASHTEIVAILSSGISFTRFLLPYVIGALAIGAFIFYLIGWVIPRSNIKRVEFENEYIFVKPKFNQQNYHVKIEDDLYVYLKNYNVDTRTGWQFSLETIEGTELKKKLKAEKITWDEEGNKWKITNYSVRDLSGPEEDFYFGSQTDTIINLTPDDFENIFSAQETLTLPELEQHIQKLRSRGAENIETYLIEKYERYTYPFAILILTVIGVIASARKSRRGTGFQIAFGFLLAIVYILFVIMSRNIAQLGSIGPLLGAWVPNIIFSIIGLIMLKTVPK